MAARVIAESKRVADREAAKAVDPYAPAQGIEAVGWGLTCVAAGLLLPYFVHIIGTSPRMVLPMHYAVLLAGILLNPIHALLVGIFTPALSMGLTGMPTPEQTLRMIPELAMYGLTVSLVLRVFPRFRFASERVSRMAAIMVALVAAMLAGRLVYVLMHSLQSGFESTAYYVSVLVSPAVAGMIMQLLLVPLVGYQLQKMINR